jgi:hypothetical protein
VSGLRPAAANESGFTLAVYFRQGGRTRRRAGRSFSRPDARRPMRPSRGALTQGRATARRGHPRHRTGTVPCPGVNPNRGGPVGLLRFRISIYWLAVDFTWAMVKQAGPAVRGQEPLDVVATCDFCCKPRTPVSARPSVRRRGLRARRAGTRAVSGRPWDRSRRLRSPSCG